MRLAQQHHQRQGKSGKRHTLDDCDDCFVPHEPYHRAIQSETQEYDGRNQHRQQAGQDFPLPDRKTEMSVTQDHAGGQRQRDGHQVKRQQYRFLDIGRQLQKAAVEQGNECADG